MKSLKVLLLILLTFNLYGQEVDKSYKDQGLKFQVPKGYETDAKRKERENKKIVEDLKPKDLSDQFSPTFNEELINRVINAGNEDLIAYAIRKEYQSNARDFFHDLVFHSLVLVIAMGLVIMYNLKRKKVGRILVLNILWLSLWYLIVSLFGKTIDDKLFLFSSNLINFFLYSFLYGVIILLFYFFLEKEQKMNISQRRVILLGYIFLFILGLGYLTGGYFNEYFYSFEYHVFNIIGLFVALILIGYLFFAKVEMK